MHQPATTRPHEIGQSIFHYDLTSDVKNRAHINECIMSTRLYTTAMASACEAGSRTVAVFASALAGTSYAQSAVQMHGAVRQVEDIAGVELGRMRQALETHWAQWGRSSAAGGVRDGAAGSSKDVELLAQCLMTFIESQFTTYKLLTQHLSQLVSSSPSSSGGNISQTSPHPSNNATNSTTQQSVQSHLDQKVKSAGGGIRNFLSQFGGAKRSDSQSSFYVPLDDGACVTSSSLSSTCADFHPSVDVAGVASTTVDQSCRTPGSQSIGVTSPTVSKREETKSIPSNANQFATQEDLDKVINMLSRSSSASGPHKAADNSASPTKIPPQQNFVNSTYAPQHLNSLLRHRPSENGTDSRGVVVGNQTVQSSENIRSVQQHPSLSHALSGPPPQTSNVHGATTNTWPYRPQEQSMWTGSDMLAMQSIFGRGPVDTSHGSISSKTTSMDAQRAGAQSTFTWPGNLNRFGGFAGNELSPAGAVNLQRLYEGGNPWSSNRGGPFGTGDAWGSYYPGWNTDRMSGAGTRGVSTIADSGSCSDESSTNGEAGHWSSSTAQQPPHQTRRRHSSGESGFPALLTTTAAPPNSSGVTPANPSRADTQPYSWRDAPRTHAPLAQSSSVIGDRSKMIVGGGGGHRALSMQYSDPTLNNRKSLSCWDRSGTVGDKPHKSSPDSGVGTMNISRGGEETGGSGRGGGGEHLDKPF